MKKQTYSNPNVDCFWLTTKMYMLSGLTKYYKNRWYSKYTFPENKYGDDPTGIISTFCNEITTITIFENNLVRYTFNGRAPIDEMQNAQGVEEIKQLLAYLEWRSVLSTFSNDNLYDEK